jgi:hypothetical protein
MQSGSGNVKKLKRLLTSIVFAVFLALKFSVKKLVKSQMFHYCFKPIDELF